jgi:hypothetical protein
MLIKYISTSILCALSLQAFSLGDATNVISSVAASNSKTATTKTTANTTQNSALMGMLTSQLGVSDKQAAGGVGSILTYAKSTLSEDKYNTLSSAVPNASSMVAAAPKTTTGALSSAMSSFGGEKSSSTGAMAGLASQFSSLGLDTSMISKFIPIIIGYFQKSDSKDSSSATNILMGLFK